MRPLPLSFRWRTWHKDRAKCAPTFRFLVTISRSICLSYSVFTTPNCHSTVSFTFKAVLRGRVLYFSGVVFCAQIRLT